MSGRTPDEVWLGGCGRHCVGWVPELMEGEKWFSWMGGARQDQKLWGLQDRRDQGEPLYKAERLGLSQREQGREWLHMGRAFTVGWHLGGRARIRVPGAKVRELQTERVRQACTWARLYFLFSSRSSYCTCLVAPVFPRCQLCSAPAAPTSHTWRSCHSQALTHTPLAPRSESVPDFPVLLLERLVQEHVEEQDAAPPGDSRSH